MEVDISWRYGGRGRDAPGRLPSQATAAGPADPGAGGRAVRCVCGRDSISWSSTASTPPALHALAKGLGTEVTALLGDPPAIAADGSMDTPELVELRRGHDVAGAQAARTTCRPYPSTLCAEIADALVGSPQRRFRAPPKAAARDRERGLAARLGRHCQLAGRRVGRGRKGAATGRAPGDPHRQDRPGAVRPGARRQRRRRLGRRPACADGVQLGCVGLTAAEPAG